MVGAERSAPPAPSSISGPPGLLSLFPFFDLRDCVALHSRAWIFASSAATAARRPGIGQRVRRRRAPGDRRRLADERSRAEGAVRARGGRSSATRTSITCATSRRSPTTAIRRARRRSSWPRPGPRSRLSRSTSSTTCSGPTSRRSRTRKRRRSAILRPRARQDREGRRLRGPRRPREPHDRVLRASRSAGPNERRPRVQRRHRPDRAPLGGPQRDARLQALLMEVSFPNAEGKLARAERAPHARDARRKDLRKLRAGPRASDAPLSHQAGVPGGGRARVRAAQGAESDGLRPGRPVHPLSRGISALRPRSSGLRSVASL